MKLTRSGAAQPAHQPDESSGYDRYMEQGTLTPGDWVKIASRRKWSLVLPAVCFMVIATTVALTLEPVYRSTSTILIEEQEIPTDFVMTTVSSFAEQRIHSITQRIMSTSRLLEIINKYNLYKKLREKRTTEEIVAKMKEEVKLQPISADTVDRRTGRATAATIAFTLSYEGKDSPQTVQKVANVLASLYLEENIKVRERQTLETFEFLETEAERMKGQLNAIEGQITRFKQEHINELPEMLQVNIQSLNNIEQNIQRSLEQLRSLKERDGFLQTQLASISPKTENPDKIRLKELETQLIYLESRFSREYPDVIKIKEEILRLEKSIVTEKIMGGGLSEQPQNPAHVTLSAQVVSTAAEIESVKRQISELETRAAEYRRRIEFSPRVEEAYKQMLIERDNAHRKYNDLLQKAMEARVAQGLEKEQKGERFTLIDPARLPEKPYKPNRPAIIIIGIVLGLAAGAGLAALREMTDQTIRNPEHLSYATQMPVLASIPFILTEGDLFRKRKRRMIGIGAGLLFVGAVVLVFHFYVMDMDIVWIKMMRRINSGL